MVPISKFFPITIGSQVKLSSQGLFMLPQGDVPLALAFNWEDEPRLLILGGETPFRHFRQQTGHFLRGLLIEDVEFLANPTSRYDPARGLVLGSLTLGSDGFSVIGQNSNSQFDDPHRIPLWFEAPNAKSEAEIGFTEWQIAVRDGENRIILWPGDGD